MNQPSEPKLPKTQLAPNLPGIRLYIEEPQVVIRREKRRAIFVILGVLILGGLILTGLVLKINKVSLALSNKQGLIHLALNQNNLNADLEKNWPSIAPLIPKIKESLPDSSDLLVYQGALEAAASAAGAQISVSFSSGDGSRQNNLKTASNIDHQVEVRGSLISFAQFLENLEKMPFYVQVNSFKLTSGKDINQEAAATLSLKVYTNPASSPNQ